MFVGFCLALWFSLDEESASWSTYFLFSCMFILSVFICVFSPSCLYSFWTWTSQFDELVKASNNELVAKYIQHALAFLMFI